MILFILFNTILFIYLFSKCMGMTREKASQICENVERFLGIPKRQIFIPSDTTEKLSDNEESDYEDEEQEKEKEKEKEKEEDFEDLLNNKEFEKLLESVVNNSDSMMDVIKLFPISKLLKALNKNPEDTSYSDIKDKQLSELNSTELNHLQGLIKEEMKNYI